MAMAATMVLLYVNGAITVMRLTPAHLTDTTAPAGLTAASLLEPVPGSVAGMVIAAMAIAQVIVGATDEATSAVVDLPAVVDSVEMRELAAVGSAAVVAVDSTVAVVAASTEAVVTVAAVTGKPSP
jgi:hypothetical protein